MRTTRRAAPTVSRTGARFPRQLLTDGPEADDPPETQHAPRRGRDMVGTTGARFRRGGPAEPVEPAEPLPTVEPFRAPAAHVAPPGPIRPAAPPPATAGPDDDPASAAAPVRPYVLTRGRTRPPVDLPVEALVSVGSAAARCTGSARALVQLCGVPRSVAEVAALAGLPLGVTRVLVGDLAAAGALVVQRTAGGEGPDLALLGRVLAGLRNL